LRDETLHLNRNKKNVIFSVEHQNSDLVGKSRLDNFVKNCSFLSEEKLSNDLFFLNIQSTPEALQIPNGKKS